MTEIPATKNELLRELESCVANFLLEAGPLEARSSAADVGKTIRSALERQLGALEWALEQEGENENTLHVSTEVSYEIARDYKWRRENSWFRKDACREGYRLIKDAVAKTAKQKTLPIKLTQWSIDDLRETLDALHSVGHTATDITSPGIKKHLQNVLDLYDVDMLRELLDALTQARDQALRKNPRTTSIAELLKYSRNGIRIVQDKEVVNHIFSEPNIATEVAWFRERLPGFLSNELRDGIFGCYLQRAKRSFTRLNVTLNEWLGGHGDKSTKEIAQLIELRASLESCLVTLDQFLGVYSLGIQRLLRAKDMARFSAIRNCLESCRRAIEAYDENKRNSSPTG